MERRRWREWGGGGGLEKVSVESALLYFPRQQQGVCNGTSISPPILPFLLLSLFSSIILLACSTAHISLSLCNLWKLLRCVPEGTTCLDVHCQSRDSLTYTWSKTSLWFLLGLVFGCWCKTHTDSVYSVICHYDHHVNVLLNLLPQRDTTIKHWLNVMLFCCFCI